MAGPREFGELAELCEEVGQDGQPPEGRVLVVISTALIRDVTWKLSNASGVKPICLWRKRTMET